MKNNLIIIICGPTGVGKTNFSIELAKRIPSEIVNIDVGQFYKPLLIGTAKPDWQNEPTLHHFFDILDEPRDLTVFEYKTSLEIKLKEIWSKNKIAILVGGSGFYIQSLFFPPISNDNKTKKNHKDIETNLDLWLELYQIDPKRANQINKNDIYRIKRALQIWQGTKIKPSEFEPQFAPICCSYDLIVLTKDRNELYKDLDERVLQMINQDWIGETEKLPNEWKDFLKRKKLIGYDDILLYFESFYNNDKNLLIKTIQQKVRNYAKRQLTFFKALTNKIKKYRNFKNQEALWVDLSKNKINEVISAILLNLKIKNNS